jgi:hypothetical protein
MCGLRCIELADRPRVARLATAPNVTLVRTRAGEVVRVNIQDFGDAATAVGMHGNSLSYSYNYETEENPKNVWALKRIPTAARPVFVAVLDECLKWHPSRFIAETRSHWAPAIGSHPHEPGGLYTVGLRLPTSR